MSNLRTFDLTKSYGGRTVVRGVSLDISSGEIVGLLGPNGAGKTTTFYMTVGLTPPDAGRVELDGHDVTDDPMYIRARKGIGYLPQEPSIFRRLTVEQNVMAILETLNLDAEQRRERLAELLDELGIARLAKSTAHSLSGGERRRVEITRALVISPSFMLLDEPFAGIDPIAVVDIQGIVTQLKKRGIGVLITDHNVRETLGICDRAYILNEGAVLEEGVPARIAESPLAREIYLGEKLPPRPVVKADKSVSIGTLDLLVGRYDYGVGILTVTREGNHLYAQLTGQPRNEIFPESPTEFFWKVVDARVTFVKDDSGKVTKAMHHQSGQTINAPRMEETKEAKIDPALYSSLLGRYDYGGGKAILTVTREDDRLFAQLTGQPKFEIFPKSPTEFFWKVVNAQVTFVKDDSGKVIKAVHHQAGRTFAAPKME